MDVRDRTLLLLDELNKGMYEREEPLKLAFLASVAGESIFFLGPPGVAKSLIARRLKFAFKECKTFEYLMNRFSTPDEMFGPVSIKKLKDEDKFERLTDKYLPGSNIVFLDEIWKAGPSIQNSLLTILNEKIYRNGDQEIKVKLRGILSASNELPAQGQGLEALWDRFLIRYYVHGIQDKNNFEKMITECNNLYCDDVTSEYKLDDSELEKFQEDIVKVEMSTEAMNTIHNVRFLLQEENKKLGENHYYVSDRRWKKIIHIIRTSAFLNGRLKVDLMDCFLIAHCIWEKPEDINAVKQIVAEAIRNNSYTMRLDIQSLDTEIANFQMDVEKEIQSEKKIDKPMLKEYDSLYYGITNFTDSDGFHVINTNNVPNQYIMINEYNTLSNEEKVVSIYEKSGHNYVKKNSYKATKGVKDFEFNIKYTENDFVRNRDMNGVFELKTMEINDTKPIRKEPHAILIDHWNNKAKNLKILVNQHKASIDDYKVTELGSIKNNIFVNDSNAEIIESKENELRKMLEGMVLSIEKTVHYYST